MAARTEVKSVWIGFMDIVPVIGTVKEAVELVLALYEGDKAVIKEKEKAVEDVVKESLKKPVKKLTQAAKPAAAAADVSEFSGLKNVKEVKKEQIIEYMMKGSKKGTKPTPSQQKDRERKVEAIRTEVLGKIHIINQNFKLDLKEQLERSIRGEHVFNNGILRFHFGVLTEFIQSRHVNDLPGYSHQVMNELGRHTLPQNTAEDIQNNMVVHFGEDEFYVNANGVIYGEYCRALRGALLAVLNRINPDDVTAEERARLNLIIDNMNNLQVYVDQLAKERWINNIQNRLERFNQVRGQVANMYSTERGSDWCDHVLQHVAPLFGY